MTDEDAPGPAARLLQSITRLAATLLGVVETRIDLLTTEISEDAARGIRILLWSVIALLAGFAALLFAGFAVIVFFRDTHPFAAASAVAATFLAIGACAALVSRRRLRDKPRLLDATRSELERDLAALKGRQ
jgi:uncharacterized membrane protein YqjE